MPPIHYRVSQPGMVTEALRIILARAKFENRLPLVLKAARFLFDELAYDPLHFGESRGFLKSAELSVRFAMCPPLSVWFAVHEPTKQVFITRINFRG